MKYCTIGVFAHANAGKTTVTENILRDTGVIASVGRVDSGNTITDNMGVERRRGITIKSSFVTFQIEDTTYQLLDTPGHVDFSAEVARAMSVLDAAIFVVSGVEGIEAQTTVIWNMLQELDIPSIIFINKLDRMGADYHRVLNEIKNSFSNKIITMQKIAYDQKLLITPCSSLEILEQLAEIDDDSLEKYLDSSEIEMDWVDQRIVDLYKNHNIICALGGSALAELGVKELIQAIQKYIPSFSGKSHNFHAITYMIKRNEGVKEAYIKILSGQLENRDLISVNNDKQKIKTLTKIVGNRRVAVDKAEEGQLVIITGIDCEAGTLLGDDLYHSCKSISVSPMFTAILCVEGVEEKIRLWDAAKELNEEDSFLNVRLNPETNNIQIDLMGKLQGETIVQILEERYNIHATLSEPTIIYKEAPISNAIGKAGYTKTSNVAIKIEPANRGDGIIYHSLLATDYLFIKYQKQVERLMYQYIKYGNYGWEITDTKISLIGGKCDNVGSDPLDYAIAAPIALARAINAAGTKLLEPIVAYSLSIPSNYYSEIIGKLMGMRKGYNDISESNDGKYIITGNAFLSEILIFVDNIREITGGRGVINYRHIGYDDAIIDEPVINPLIANPPQNETKFVLSMNGSLENLDKGLETKRGKPEKIKRNKHLWKK